MLNRLFALIMSLIFAVCGWTFGSDGSNAAVIDEEVIEAEGDMIDESAFEGVDTGIDEMIEDEIIEGEGEQA